MAYAEETKVPIERTRAEIEALIARHKCSAYMTGTDHDTNKAIVQFRAHSRIVRFVLDLPNRQHKVFAQRSKPIGDRAYEQALRTKWRALLLVIKAKLEAVEANIATFEDEFLAHIVLPNDKTVAQTITPMIAQAYETGQMPKRLLALPGVGETTVVEGEKV